MRLTEHAHQRLSEVLHPGDWAIDATAGNGHDTLFLARTVGPTGKVVAFDIQTRAYEETIRRLESAQLTNVEFHLLDHALMDTILLEEDWHRIRAVTFNLGYLPGGDKRVITTPASTLRALTTVQRLIHAGALLTILAYPEHAGGDAETQVVTDWVKSLPNHFRVDQLTGDSPKSPILFTVERRS